MPSLAQCGSCKKTLRIPDHLIGKSVKCPSCQTLVKFEAEEEIYTAPVAKGERPAKAAPSPAPRGTPGFGKGADRIMAGFSAAKAAAQARIRKSALNAQMTASYRALGEAAAQAGWGGETRDAIVAKKAECAEASARRDKAASDAEMAKNTAGAGLANQALTGADAQVKLAEGVLEGLREKAGRAAMDDASFPADLCWEERAEILRLRREVSDCDAIMSVGAKGLFSKPMIKTAAILLVAAALCLAGGWAGWSLISMEGGNSLKRSKPGDWARYDIMARTEGADPTKGSLLVEVMDNDGQTVGIRTSLSETGMRAEPSSRHFHDVDLRKSPEEIALSLMGENLSGMDGAAIKTDIGKKTRETLVVAGKSYPCVVTPFTMAITGGPDGMAITITGKQWNSSAAPVDGTMKEEIDVLTVTKQASTTTVMNMMFVASGHDPSLPQEAVKVRCEGNEANAILALRRYQAAQAEWYNAVYSLKAAGSQAVAGSYNRDEKEYALPFFDLYALKADGTTPVALIPPSFARATSPDAAWNGYYFIHFNEDGASQNKYELAAVPAKYGATGTHVFRIALRGAVKQADLRADFGVNEIKRRLLLENNWTNVRENFQGFTLE